MLIQENLNSTLAFVALRLLKSNNILNPFYLHAGLAKPAQFRTIFALVQICTFSSLYRAFMHLSSVLCKFVLKYYYIFFHGV